MSQNKMLKEMMKNIEVDTLRMVLNNVFYVGSNALIEFD